MTPRPYTIAEVAERWDYSVHSVRRLIKKGELPCIRVGPRKVLVPAAAVEEREREMYASRLQAAPTTETATLGPSSGQKEEKRDGIERARMMRQLQSAPSKNG